MQKRILSIISAGIFAVAVAAGHVAQNTADSGVAAAVQTSALSADSDTTGPSEEPGWQ
ncbi:hypothetical protein ACKI1I_38490 [Streptomyces turgidiscabies]|uniref:DUF680 domain-containing protein n=1 Tax=Streptomyces turgidiscabies (strain Car8) TaxID=698760 RepID=L7FH30_STRT8|nr:MULTISPECIES: hypothetical protein [Streptomyces]ELP70698.1 hypothetical protein STRTUCAR8_04286 [Streptomyces turgidiscabies Car8]MDX3496012.1 hypothetical protein [Streptomyces turgidiscabies]GAQ72499.1 hypothetical protein T45_04251 [Streptomyces turgidiscabies]